MVICVPDSGLADNLDRLLWTQSQLSFIPHCRAESPLASETPIILARTLDNSPDGERLMNLGRETPTGFERYANLVEVVSQDEDDRLAARDRVRWYKEQGLEVHYFDLSNR